MFVYLLLIIFILGQNSIVVVLGANEEMTIDDVHEAEKYIKQSKVMTCQLEIPPEVSLEALRSGKKHNGMLFKNGVF